MVELRSDNRRAALIVLDSVGIGELPDASEYGDAGSNTVGNIARTLGGLRLPHLQSLGLGNILAVEGVPPVAQPAGAHGRMREASAGKDTTTGHWELAGIVLERPFPVYPGGFPPEIVAAFVARIGRSILGNKVASGTEIIAELGAEHVLTGHPIVYTSADSVFQVAAHEDVVSVEELYRICGIARELLAGEHAVGRVIARPFTGRPGAFTRTGHRKDFSLPPPEGTLLDVLASAGLPVFGVGKIEDIFAGRGLTGVNHTTTNKAGIEATLEWMRTAQRGLCFANLVDFDMVYGHRNDVSGYAKALEEFDAFLPELLKTLSREDLVIVTADHGCDPTTPSTDHSREYVPLFVLGGAVKSGVDLGTRTTFADAGATVAEWLGAAPLRAGKSFLNEHV